MPKQPIQNTTDAENSMQDDFTEELLEERSDENAPRLPDAPGETSSEFEALLDHLKRSRGFDFTGYKRASLMRRVNKQMSIVGVEFYADYMDYLEANPDEITHLLSTLLINVTSFFRDAPVWESLQNEIVPQLLATRTDDQPIRAWSAGSASGEEAFTIAILLAETLGQENFNRRVKIYATDIDEDALNQARQSTFSAAQVAEVPDALLNKYFTLVGGRYVLSKELRRAVIFGQHNLVHDVPISHLDLLLCRNTLMYFNAEVQAKILARFHFALNDSGCLILGKAETLLINSHLFAPLDLKRRIFAKISQAGGRRRPIALPPVEMDDAPLHVSGEANFAQIAFDSSSYAQFVVNAGGILVLANERARTLFRLTQRDIGHPFQDMELSYRPVELRSFIAKVTAEGYPIVLKEIVSRGDGETTFFDVQIVPLLGSASGASGVSVSFLDVTPYRRLREELEASNREIATAYGEAQSAAEELETTNEELQASAEELETTNEELQSTNEEMETMNEELQSANEELQTMNDEMRQRSEELSQISGFMESVMGSLRSGIVVTDVDLRVQTWNRQAEDLWGLRSDEAVGHSLLGLDIGLTIETLMSGLRDCLSGASNFEETVVEATNRRGRAIRCRVSGTPLRDSEGRTQGVILVMQDAQPQAFARDGDTAAEGDFSSSNSEDYIARVRDESGPPDLQKDAGR